MIGVCHSLSHVGNLSITSLTSVKCFVCVWGEEAQLLMPNLILYIGMHYISGPYWLFVTDDVGYLLLCMLTSSPIFTV